MSLRFFLILTAVLLATPAAAQWDRQFWDPGDPVEDQIEIPLPCDGMMVFLRVTTPVAEGDPLSDREIRIGSTEAETGYLDFFRTEYLRGGFSDGDKSFFYLAKYEVTRDQWQAVMGDACPEPKRGGTRPQMGVSWFAGIEFSRRLTEWLHSNVSAELPSEDGTLGHLRLPTEAEWEYAARGGTAVDLTDFRAGLPPMDGQVGDYAWFAGRRSANGNSRPIGMKKANPLGLHEMLGSAEELTLEPFRLNNLGRLHGQVGGFVTRGGSVQTEEIELRSALRAEWPFFDPGTGAATAVETVGIRPVISVQVNTTLAKSTEIQDLWMDRFSSNQTLGSDPLAILDELMERQSDKRLREELAFVRSEMTADRRARDEAAAQATRLSILNGAVLMQWVRSSWEDIERRETVIDIYNKRVSEATSDAARTRFGRIRDQQQLRLDASREAYGLAGSIYLETLIRLDETQDDAELDTQKGVLILELADRNQDGLALAVEKFIENIAARGRFPNLSREEMLQATLGRR